MLGIENIRSIKRLSRTCAGCGVAAVLSAVSPVFAGAATMEFIKPSQADPRVTQFDDPNVVLSPSDRAVAAPLFVFLPGTHGRPQNVTRLLQVAADQGYRVIGLSYDDEPAVAQVCPRDPDPACSAEFRQARIWGLADGHMPTPPAEAIAVRLTMLLRRLAATHPASGWDSYLDPHGDLVWSKLVIAGFSQGAGMAAFIAKQHAVARVVLFSSPWDTTGPDRQPAPWLFQPSATPPDRWWAERHVQENTTKLIAHAYAALQIPERQVIIFDHPIAPAAAGQENPFHSSTVRRADYEPEWRVLFGHAGGPDE